MAGAGTVTVDFAAETAKFTAELKKVRSDLKQTNEQFEGLANVARTALAVFAGGSIVAGLRAAAQAADDFGKSADKIGVTTSALASFHLAADLAGVSIETMDKLLVDAQTNLGKAALGTGKAGKVIAALGLSIADLKALAPDELFSRYSEAISGLANRGERLAAAQALFGKSAADAFNLIEAGRGPLEEARAAVDRYGLALSRTDIAKIEVANDQISLLGKISATTGQRIAAGLAPFVSAVADSLLAATGNTEGMQVAAEKLGAIVYTAFQIAANGVHALTAAFFGVAAAGARVLQALTFGDVSDAFGASVDANLAKADAALGKVKSIEEIQAGIIATLEESRQKAQALVDEQKNRPVGVETLEDDGSAKFAEDLAAMQVLHDEMLLKMAASTEAAIERTGTAISADFLKNLEAQNDAAEAQAQYRIELEAATQAQINAYQQTGIQNAANYLAGFGGKYKTFSAALLLFQKRGAIAQAIIDTKNAVMRTYALLGYPWGIPAAIAVGAIGLANIAAIAGVQPGSGGGGGGAGGGGAGGIATPNNAVFQDQAPQDRGADARSSVQIFIQQTGFIGERQTQEMIDAIREEIGAKDIILIPSGSRQAQELQVQA